MRPTAIGGATNSHKGEMAKLNWTECASACKLYAYENDAWGYGDMRRIVHVLRDGGGA